tara:strand:+ start:43 stop:456 length:414 start_codon:yes stop_codon:yes gene_type:complete
MTAQKRTITKRAKGRIAKKSIKGTKLHVKKFYGGSANTDNNKNDSECNSVRKNPASILNLKNANEELKSKIKKKNEINTMAINKLEEIERLYNQIIEKLENITSTEVQSGVESLKALSSKRQEVKELLGGKKISSNK